MTLLSVIVLVLWIDAFFQTLLNLALIPRLRLGSPVTGPLVSVIIPARNEERKIELTVRAFLKQRYENLEVIVINDRSTDATEATLRRIASENSRLVVIHGEDPPAGWLGKPWALHQGSCRARGEFLLFVDADIFYAPESVAAAIEQIERSKASMTTLLPRFEMAGVWENVAMPMLAITVFTFLPTWFGNRSRMISLAMGAGTGNLIRRGDYDAIGGHESLRDAVVDDVGLARFVRRSGRRTMVVLADHFVSLRMYHGAAEIIDGFTKNLFSAVGRSYVIALLSVAAGFAFHILPYLLALTGERLSMATVLVITLTRVILFKALRYRLSSALLAHPLMVAFWSWITLRSMWLTGIRGQLIWRGRSYDPKG